MEGDYCETCAGVTHCWMCEKWGVPRVEAVGTGHVIVCSTDGEYRHVDLCRSCIDDPQRHYRRAKANLQRRASSYSFLNYMPE